MGAMFAIAIGRWATGWVVQLVGWRRRDRVLRAAGSRSIWKADLDRSAVR